MKSFPVIATIVGTLLALAAGTPVQHHHHRHAASTKALETRDPNAAVTAPYGSTYYNPNFNAGGPGYGASHNMYTCYAGTWKNFPPPAQWISFSSLWQFQVNNALKPIGDNSSEIQAIYDGIVQVSQVSKIDARVILAVIIQESTGNVHVGCTNNGVENCGLMQSHDPPVKAYDPNNYQASITQMVCHRCPTQGLCGQVGLTFRPDPRRHSGDDHGSGPCPIYEQRARHRRQNGRHLMVRPTRVQFGRRQHERLQRRHGCDAELCVRHCKLPAGLAGIWQSKSGHVCVVKYAWAGVTSLGFDADFLWICVATKNRKHDILGYLKQSTNNHKSTRGQHISKV